MNRSAVGTLGQSVMVYFTLDLENKQHVAYNKTQNKQLSPSSTRLCVFKENMIVLQLTEMSNATDNKEHTVGLFLKSPYRIWQIINVELE